MPGYASFASPNEWNGTMNPGGYNDGTRQTAQLSRWQLPEGEGSNIAQRKHHAPSPYDMAPEQLESLFYAGKSAQSFSTTIDERGHHNKALFGGRARIISSCRVTAQPLISLGCSIRPAR